MDWVVFLISQLDNINDVQSIDKDDIANEASCYLQRKVPSILLDCQSAYRKDADTTRIC